MAEYIVPSENYPLPQRLTYFKEDIAQGLSHHSMLVQCYFPVACTVNMNCHNLFKLKKMLFIAPQLLESLRLDFFLVTNCHRKVKNTRANNLFEIEINFKEESSAFKDFL